MMLYFFAYCFGVIYFFTNLLSNGIMEIITFIGSILSFAATIIIAVAQYKQGKRMEEQGNRMEGLAFKQDEAQRKERAQKIKAERNSFIMKYYNDDDEIYMLPLCWIASVYDPAHAYHRKMYMEFNMLEEDVQKAICEYMHFNVRKPPNEREAFYSDCVHALQEAEKRESIKPHPDTIFYDNAKYLRRTFERYGKMKLPIELGYLENIFTDLLRDYRENPVDCKEPLKEFLLKTGYYSAEEAKACEICAVVSKWLAEVHIDLTSEEFENYWVSGEYGFESISTMEDLFLCALFCTYVFLILPNKKGKIDDQTRKIACRALSE